MTFGRKAFASLACAAALLGAACQQTNVREAPVAFMYEVSPRPPKVGPAVFTFGLTDEASSKPLGGARVKLEANMTHAGMRPVFAEAEEFEPGRYRTTLQFTMGGDWVVIVHAALPDGRQVERRLDVRNVSAD